MCLCVRERVPETHAPRKKRCKGATGLRGKEVGREHAPIPTLLFHCSCLAVFMTISSGYKEIETVMHTFISRSCNGYPEHLLPSVLCLLLFVQGEGFVLVAPWLSWGPPGALRTQADM